MTEIIVIGDERDTALEKLIKGCLSATYRILYIKGNSFSDTGAGYELVFHDSERPRLHGIHSSVIIAKRSAVLDGMLPADCTVIVSADRQAQLDAVRKSGAFAVECGLSPTSTVSFSSMILAFFLVCCIMKISIASITKAMSNVRMRL